MTDWMLLIVKKSLESSLEARETVRVLSVFWISPYGVHWSLGCCLKSGYSCEMA